MTHRTSLYPVVRGCQVVRARALMLHSSNKHCEPVFRVSIDRFQFSLFGVRVPVCGTQAAKGLPVKTKLTANILDDFGGVQNPNRLSTNVSNFVRPDTRPPTVPTADY
jgi:hypothetical protein